MVSMGGLWVKLGQMISTRADVFPAPIIKQLKLLQDALPPRPFEEVEEALRLSFPTWPFAAVSVEPLATASIAQVHRATLLDGTRVVVKVRHKGIQAVLDQDLDNAQYIVESLAEEKPQLDFRVIFQEWAAETRKETNFRQEAENTETVFWNLRELAAKQIARVPKVIPRTVYIPTIPTRSVLVLEFIEGVKPTEREVILRTWGADGNAVMDQISAAFAQQIFVDGIFNGDPHPGNFLIERVEPTTVRSDMPVLLDFGLVKRIPTKLRMAFCRLLVAAHEQDISALLCALGELGVGEQASLARPDRALQFVRFAFRDAEPEKSFDEQKSEWTPEDHDDVEDTFSDIEEEEDEEDEEDLQAGGVMFLLRVISCLRGISVSLGVGHSYLHSMAPFARSALRRLEFSPTPTMIGNKKVQVLNDPQTVLIEKLVYKLTELRDQDLVCGLQMCVFKKNVKVIDFAFGELGRVDPRPYKRTTLVNAFSCGKILPVLLIHIFVDRGWIDSLDDFVADYWPAFSKNGKGKITIRDALEHKTGLARAFPTKSIRAICDFAVMKKWIASAKPDPEQKNSENYHVLTHGWILAGLAEEVYNRKVLKLGEEQL
ncbi:unnamed protein product, partial [Amoebophrya sp. A25]|eukprot:GSA25T00026829001.1